ncbi:MAG: NAD(P)-dependent oxidoreductase [Ramlibacter sp.]|nr:NAD(P)-dependent oxidoreductase [Ramlibacter sp.]
MKRIGMVGLGVMGRGIANNLLAKGFALTVHARDAAKAEPFTASGAASAATPADLGRQCDAVILSVSATADVEHVVFGPEGLASRPSALKYVIDTSTIAADASRMFAERLARQGIAFLDAPVSGGEKGAAEGTLACMVGGTEDAFAACLPVLQAFAKNITRVGDSGAGQICKACNQIGVIANMLGVAEIVALCLKNDIDPRVVRSVLLNGSSRSAAMDTHGQRLIERQFEPAGFRAELMRKDLRLAIALEQASGMRGPITTVAEPLFARLVDAMQQGQLDWSAIGTVVQQMGIDEDAGADALGCG